MKTGLIVALVLCVAAAAFFDPVNAEEEDAATQLGEDERLFSGNVEPLTRDLQGAEGADDADADATEATGTDLEKDPSEGMMRDLKTYYKYGQKTGYYRPYSKTGHYYPKPGYSKAGQGRRLSGYGGYYYPSYKGGHYTYGHKGSHYTYGHKGSHYGGRRLSGYGGYGRGYGYAHGYGGYYRRSYGHYSKGL